MSIEEGIKDFGKHIEAFFKGETAAHPALQQAATFLKNSLATIAKEIETKGLPVVEKAAADLAAQLEAAASGAESKAAAGNAAIATVKTAGTTVVDDALHILVTDALTDAAALLKAV